MILLIKRIINFLKAVLGNGTAQTAVKSVNVNNKKCYQKSEKTYEVIQKQIVDLSYLKTGWDSYNAPVPNDIAIKNSLRIIPYLLDLTIEKTLSIVPSAEGGIAFCFITKDYYADIEVFNDGSIIGVKYHNKEEEPTIIPIDGSESSIIKTLKMIKKDILNNKRKSQC